MKNKNNYPVGVPKNLPKVKIDYRPWGEKELNDLVKNLEEEGHLNTAEKLKQIIEKGLPDSIQELLKE